MDYDAVALNWFTGNHPNGVIMVRLNSGIRNCHIFFGWAFFCFKKLEVIQWIMLFLETSNFFSTPWDFDFEIFHEFLKMRRWRWYAWANPYQNLRKCIELYLQQVELIKLSRLFDFGSTYAISTHVKCKIRGIQPRYDSFSFYFYKLKLPFFIGPKK